MRNLLFALSLGLLAAGPVRAAPYDGSADLGGGHARKDPVPETGVEEKPRRGTYVETTLGIFTTIGGNPVFSNGQPYLGLTVGHEFGQSVAIFASLGVGASSASCFQLDATGNCLAADSFGATYLEAGASYGFPLSYRLLLSARLVAGVTNLSPAPVRNKDNTVADNMFGPHAGVGLGLDYDTHLDHFAVGIDALVRYSLANRSDGSGSLGLASLAFMPRVRYVF